MAISYSEYVSTSVPVCCIGRALQVRPNRDKMQKLHAEQQYGRNPLEQMINGDLIATLYQVNIET